MSCRRFYIVVFALPILTLAAGCHTVPKSNVITKTKPIETRKVNVVDKSLPTQTDEAIPDQDLPKELNKISLPPYVVETPDVLLIQAKRLVPLPPYKVQPLDQLRIVVQNSLSLANPEARINGIYPVDPDGTIMLAREYGGAVRVIDLATQDVEKLLTRQLAPSFVEALRVSVSLAISQGVETIRGEHAVKTDGTINLGTYGELSVAGKTLGQVKATIETQLAKYFLRPEISVDVKATRSKFYYVIADLAGNGEVVVRVPATGNDTVLDAVSQVAGLSAIATKKIWVARPTSAGTGDQILPVDWKGISQRGQTRTNYQLMPGDRVYVSGNYLMTLDTKLGLPIPQAERATKTSSSNLSRFKASLGIPESE
jgi:polysaccharide export outer membrane protein